MKAAIFYEPNPILSIEDIDIMSPLKGEVLVKLTAAGVCHSDYHFMTGKMIPPKSPFIMGHEGAGIIEEIGKDVQNIKVGNKVLLSMDAICGNCKNCKLGKETLCSTYGRTFTMPDGTTRFYKNNIKYYHMVGTFSEYTILPAEQVIVVPDNSPLEKICIIGCAVITGVGAVINRAQVKPGSTMAVFGCGGVGLNVIQGGVLSSASKIIAIDTISNKLSMAKKLGATHTINALKTDPIDAIKEINSGPVDYAFEVVGNPKIAEQVFASIAPGGTAILVGIQPPKTKISVDAWELIKDKTLMGSFHGSAKPSKDFLWLIDLYESGKLKLDELITQYRPLNEINQAFNDLIEGRTIRTVITFK